MCSNIVDIYNQSLILSEIIIRCLCCFPLSLFQEEMFFLSIKTRGDLARPGLADVFIFLQRKTCNGADTSHNVGSH